MVDNPIYQGDRNEPMYESVPPQSQTTHNVIQQDNNDLAKLNDDCNTKLDSSVVDINPARYVDHEFQLFRPTRSQSLNIQVHSSDTDHCNCNTESKFKVSPGSNAVTITSWKEDVENEVFLTPQTSHKGDGTVDVDTGEGIVIAIIMHNLGNLHFSATAGHTAYDIVPQVEEKMHSITMHDSSQSECFQLIT